EAIESFNANKNSKNHGSKSNPGASWTPLGPSDWDDGAGWNAGNGRINVVVQDPVNSNTVYVGAASGGLWKSTNGGTTWTNLTDDQPVLGVSGIAIDPDDTNVIYIGTGDGDASDTYSVGVLKSTDGGNTWNTTGLNWSILSGRVIRKLQMHPDNPDTLFAATSNGLYKTMDAGASWTNVLSVSAQDVEIHPSNPSIVYTCTDQFYRSTDGGNTFTLVTTGLPTAANINRFKIAVSADEPDWVYVVGGKQSDHTFEGIYRSVDAGVSFTVGTNTPNMFGYDTNGNDNSGQSWYDMAIAVNPANADEVYIADVNVWKSTNGGTSFTIITQWTFPNSIGYVHADVHELAFFGSRIYSGSDGGVYKSDNLGDDWTNLTVGITIMQFYDISGTPQNANLLMGGAQDNGTNRYTGTPDWTHMIGADGMNCQIDPTNQSILYGAIQYGQIYKSTNGGASISVIVNAGDFGESGNWVAPYALAPDDPNTIFVGYEDVHKSIDGGANWTSLTSTGSTTTIYCLEIAPSNSDYIYITKSSTIYRTTNGGTSWTNVSTGLPGLFITDIAIDPENTDRVWVSLSGYTAGSKIWRTENGGSTWTNVSGNLPNLPANCIAFQPNTNDILYVGMDVGIYTKNAAQTDWTSCSTDLPNVIINEIEINTGVNKIQVGRYGRGA
ncbi:MAG: glycosyl hydrolase, partial [Bacteroidota bacterium]